MDSSFQVHLTRNAEKDLLRLRELMPKAVEQILTLKQDPLKGHPLKGSLAGVRSLEFSLVGVAYRATYAVQPEDSVCLVFLVGPHEGFYEKAQRRAKGLGL